MFRSENFHLKTIPLDSNNINGCGADQPEGLLFNGYIELIVLTRTLTDIVAIA